MSQREPVFNIPSSTINFLGIIIGVHLVLLLLSYTDVESYNWLTGALVFIPQRTMSVFQNFDITAITSIVTYMFVHAGTEHIVLNSLFIMAFGSAVAKRLGSSRFYIFTFLTGVAGIMLHLYVYSNDHSPVLGASAAASGYVAGAMILIFSAYRYKQLPLVSKDPARIRLMTPIELLTDFRVIVVVGLWIIINWLIGVLGIGAGEDTRIAWEAHLGGFVAGLICIYLLGGQHLETEENEEPTGEA